MSKQFWRTLALIVVTMLTSLLLVVGQTFLVSATVPKQNAIAQVTSESQMTSDVKPTDYYFQSLQSLVERYGCITGFKDKTIRPARGLQAAELISMLNACMDKLEELQTASTAATSNAEDLGTMQKRLKEIEADVSSMRRQS